MRESGRGARVRRTTAATRSRACRRGRRVVEATAVIGVSVCEEIVSATRVSVSVSVGIFGNG